MNEDYGNPWHTKPIPVGALAINTLSLRDHFAALAMQSAINRLAGEGGLYDEGGCTYSRVAVESYKVADAMLAERDIK